MNNFSYTAKIAMKDKTKFTLIFPVVIILLFGAGVTCINAQQPEQPNDGPQGSVVEDPIRELNLTPEQREQIRAIRQETQQERTSINLRLRASNRALQETLDSDNPDEATVEQLVRQVATLLGAQMRLRVLSEVRIRRVLTPEQRVVLRNLRLSRQQRRNGPLQNPRRDGVDDLRRFPNRRNGLGPLGTRPRP